MTQNILLFILLVGSLQSNAQIISKSNFEIGESITIHSAILDEDRILNIYLPNNYHEQDSIDYSVIYLLDGSAHEDFLHVVGLVQFFELQFQIKPVILVGISNVDRKRDFTFHTEDKELQNLFPTAGKSAKFISFLEKELHPFIDKTYKTNTEKIIIGQSLGGLLATEILLTKPSLFSTYIIVSPSLWWDNESLLKKAPELIKNKAKVKVVISVGKEGKIMVSEAKKIYRITKKAPQIKSYFQFLKKDNHASILHNAIYQSFLKIFVNLTPHKL